MLTRLAADAVIVNVGLLLGLCARLVGHALFAEAPVDDASVQKMLRSLATFYASGTPLLPSLQAQDGGNWAPAADGIYFVRRAGDDVPRVARFSPADGSTVDLAPLPAGFIGLGMDVSPDQRQLVLAELVTRESDLRLAVPR